jgi:hypothetical protein
VLQENTTVKAWSGLAMALRFAAAMCLLAVLSGEARAQHPEGHMHAHHGGDAAVVQMRLDDGRKWPTDESLRSGMAAIRTAFDAHHPAIHAGSETDAQYAALAQEIETQVNSIVEHCSLPPDADANLHFVIADLSSGVLRMRGADPSATRHDGAALVHGALIAYGERFDDPTWASATPIHHGD